MWLLNGPKDQLIYLKRNATIVVSRTQGDIVLRDDKSVSRSHASVSVECRNSKSLCIVKDLGSKYGSTVTRVHGEKIKVTSKGINLQHLDVIKFGMQENDYTVHYYPIVVLVSSLNERDIEHLLSIVNELDGCIVRNWKEQSDKVTHLTTPKAKLGEKVALALVKCIPIVGIQYWEVVQDAIANSREWPNATEYILPIEENVIDKEKVSLGPNPDRKKLFNNLTFLFFSLSQFKIYKEIVIGAGGEAIMYNASIHTDLTKFCSDGFVVVYYMIGSNQTEESILDSQTLKTGYEKIEELLRKGKRRMISDSEILLAVLRCSVKQHCNPKHNFKELLVESKKTVSNYNKKASVFALDTQDVRSKMSSNCSSENIITDTNESTNQELEKSPTETQSSLVNFPVENRPPSPGLSSISSIHLDSQESTGDIETNFANMIMDRKRTEKRTLEAFSFAPTKKLKLDSGSSLFPVLPKSKSQDKFSQSLRASQRLQCSQNLIGSQNVQSSQASIPALFSQSIQRISQKNNSLEPSTSRNSGEGTKSKPKHNIFGDRLDDSREDEKEVIVESSLESETRNELNMKIIEKKKSQETEKLVSKIWIRSDSSLLDDTRSDVMSKDRIEAKIPLNLEGKRKGSSMDESISICEEPAPKKKRIEANSNLRDFRISTERSDKRKRGIGDGEGDTHSDSNEAGMQKKQQKRMNSFNQISSDSSGIIIGSNKECAPLVTGLIRKDFTDSLLEQSFYQKSFQKVYHLTPRTRVIYETMKPYKPEETSALN